MTLDPSNLSWSKSYIVNQSLIIWNGDGFHISKIDYNQLQSTFSHDRYLKMSNIILVPNIAKNLLSVSQLAKDDSVFFEFHYSSCFFKDNNMGRFCSRVYSVIDYKNLISHCARKVKTPVLFCMLIKSTLVMYIKLLLSLLIWLAFLCGIRD